MRLLGAWELWKRMVQKSPAIAPNGQPVEYEWLGSLASEVDSLTPEDLYRKQPHLRTVVPFLARNVAQLGLHTFERVNETDRKRVREGVVADVLSRPNSETTSFELINALVSDLALHDEAYLWARATNTGFDLYVMPASWAVTRSVNTTVGAITGPTEYTFIAPGAQDQKEVRIPADQVVHFHGWDPELVHCGESPVTALRSTLKEQLEAFKFRAQRYGSGGRYGMVIERPAEAPSGKALTWDAGSRGRFLSDLRDKYSGDGPHAGGELLLEDGMTAKQLGFSAHEDEFIAASELSLKTVCGVYQIDPMLILGGSTYAGGKEASKRLYRDTLGPLLAMIEDRLNTFLLPMLGASEGQYVEFNVAEKLQGSFEEQATVLQSSVGAPWMTVNEGRSRMNLPAVDGGDALVKPLNVTNGDQASPNDSGSQNVNPFAESHDDEPKARRVMTKGRASEERVRQAADIFRKHFERQQRSVMPALSAKSFADWWDRERWNRELAADLQKFATEVVLEVATDTLSKGGYAPSTFNGAWSENFLKSVCTSRSRWINDSTYDAIQAIIDAGEGDPNDAFESAKSARAEEAGETLVTTLSSIGTAEGARAAETDEQPRKVWRHNPSEHPRSTHKAWDGMEAGLDDRFELNGAMWPGDPVLGASDTVYCRCEIDIVWPDN